MDELKVLNRIYRKDTESNAFIIDVSLDKYSDLFNEYDPTPFKIRDLDPDLIFFLEECSWEIPLKYPLILRFHMPGSKYDRDLESRCISGLKTNFEINYTLAVREIKKSNRQVFFYSVSGFVFLLVATLCEQTLDLSVLFTTFTQGLFIGGWVFLWEAFSILFLQWDETRKKIGMCRRFCEACIVFKYDGDLPEIS